MGTPQENHSSLVTADRRRVTFPSMLEISLGSRLLLSLSCLKVKGTMEWTLDRVWMFDFGVGGIGGDALHGTFVAWGGC